MSTRPIIETFDGERYFIVEKGNEYQGFRKDDDGTISLSFNYGFLAAIRDGQDKEGEIPIERIKKFESPHFGVNILSFNRSNIEHLTIPYVTGKLQITDANLKSIKITDPDKCVPEEKSLAANYFIYDNPDIEELVLPSKMGLLYIDASVYYRFKDYIDRTPIIHYFRIYY